MARIRLDPLGETLDAEPGAPLRDLLFPFGVEFPCAGRGRCRRCRVKVLAGSLAGSSDQRSILTRDEWGQGWRLGCRCAIEGDVTLEIRQWEASILSDSTPLRFRARSGLGVAIDLGTTTIVAQLMDLESGDVLAVRTGLNPQVSQGSDVMSRVHRALADGGSESLTATVREALGRLVAELLAAACAGAERGIREVVIVGNTVMHHLFCAIDLEPLSHHPFEAVRDDLQQFRARELGWEVPGDPAVQFLPCLGGFVGSDILAGILALGMVERDALTALLDLGTNGEIVLGRGGEIVCASTAAGPAFEGGRISAGMRAGTGAIAGVARRDGELVLDVIGGGEPRGLCGSGLVDAVAVGLDLGTIDPSGRLLREDKRWQLCAPVALLQQDVRELQLAKGAIAAGLRILLRQIGAEIGDIQQAYLAGAFGNYVGRESASRIGLLELPIERVEAAGNTALLGAKIALCSAEGADRDFGELRAHIRHVSLAADPEFQETYVDAMRFPEQGRNGPSFDARSG